MGTQAANPDYARHALDIINLLIYEANGINDSMRLARGEPPLSSAPTLESLDDELLLEAELVQRALLYGLCAKLLVDDDLARAAYFQNLYTAGARGCVCASASPIADVYG